jgi:hypothetical protein
MNLPEIICFHWCEIQIMNDKIHPEAGRSPDRILVPGEDLPQCRQIFRALEAVEIVRIFSNEEACRLQRLQCFSVRNAGPPPVITLKQEERPIEVTPFYGEECASAFDDAANDASHYAALELCSRMTWPIIFVRTRCS